MNPEQDPLASPEVQRFLTEFFQRRDSEVERYLDLAHLLIKNGSISIENKGASLRCEILDGGLKSYVLPKSDRRLLCPLTHENLTGEQQTDLNILVDAIAEAETLAILGYSPH